MFLQTYIWAGCVTLENLSKVLPTTYWDPETLMGSLRDGVDELMTRTTRYVDTIHATKAYTPKYYRVASDLCSVMMLCADIYRAEDLDEILFQCKGQFSKWPTSRLASLNWRNPYLPGVQVLADQGGTRFYRAVPGGSSHEDTYSLSPEFCFASYSEEEQFVLTDAFLHCANEKFKVNHDSIDQHGIQWVPVERLAQVQALGASWEPVAPAAAAVKGDFDPERVANLMLNSWREIWESRRGIRQAIADYEARQQGVSKLDLK